TTSPTSCANGWRRSRNGAKRAWEPISRKSKVLKACQSAPSKHCVRDGCMTLRNWYGGGTLNGEDRLLYRRRADPYRAGPGGAGWGRFFPPGGNAPRHYTAS